MENLQGFFLTTYYNTNSIVPVLKLINKSLFLKKLRPKRPSTKVVIGKLYDIISKLLRIKFNAFIFFILT